MATSNFARGNTSKVFSVLMNTEETYKECSECGHKHYDWEYNLTDLTECENSCEGAVLTEETEDVSPESYQCEEFKDNLREVANSKETPFTYYEEEGSDHDRNYNATNLFSFQTSKGYGDLTVELKIVGKIVSAYYEGASLDYDLYVYNGWEWSEVDRNFSVADIVESYFETAYKDHGTSDMGQGLRKMLYKKAAGWAEKEAQKMIETVEQIFTDTSEPLNVVATFSNGGTVYQKVS